MAGYQGIYKACCQLGFGPVRIEVDPQLDEAQIAQVSSLIPHLSSSASPPPPEHVREVIESEASHLIVALEGAQVIGVLVLICAPILTGLRAQVEDVVVDPAHRGKGAGKALVKRALALASELGASAVDLTSRPSRLEANALYRSLGFEQRETNVYRFRLS